jgi:hypothetical protein
VSKFYNRLGLPITLHEWADLIADREYCKIANTLVTARWEVSTVWLGLDHQFWDGPPLIFETMVFGRVGDNTRMLPDEMEMRRYTTEAQARAGHEAMVQLVAAIEDCGPSEAREGTT